MKPQNIDEKAWEKRRYLMIKNPQTFVKERGESADINNALHLAREWIRFS